MPEYNVVDNVYEIPLNQIKILPERYRKDMGDLEDLAESIKAYGLLIPIIITSNYTLIAGERRLRAHELLGLESIKCVIRTSEDIGNKIVEIIENKDRKDFTWQEQVLAMEDLYNMMEAIEGPDFSRRKAAEKIGVSKSGVISDVELARALQENPDIFDKCDSKRKAIKALQQFKIDETMAEISLRESKKDYGKHARNHVFLGDCTKLIDKIPDGLINAVISDPFYGIDIDDTKKMDSDSKVSKIYDDSENLYKTVMGELVSKLPRVLAEDSWVLFFCAIQHFPWLHSTMEKAGLKCDAIPGIWYKTGTSGQTNQPQVNFSRVYEVFIYGRKGEPTMVKQGQPNVLVHQVVHSIMKDHPVEKPISLMEELITRLCLPGYVVLDPMCGSASTLVSAIKRGCNPIGFELDERYFNISIKNVSDALRMKDAGKADLVR